ncbi:MAG: sugar ABC transporter ATP-binding protein [Anaerolineae bacterium]|nr:sugar ABC transporter ATP-binding protein [Anaerolineae bacterium]
MSALLEVRNLTKRFPGVAALDNVSLALAPGEVHALVGENGAGKSTLVKILTGVHDADAGEILWKGGAVPALTPALGRALGISAIYQETSLIPNLSVAENIFLGRLPETAPTIVDWGALQRSAQEILSQLGTRVSPRERVSALNMIEQRMVEVARSLSSRSDLIIMDEPTAALGANEISVLFDTIRQLKARGVAILYISHFLEEVFQVADRVTVLRDGRRVNTVSTAETSAGEIVYMMAGRHLDLQTQITSTPQERVLLRADRLSRQNAFYDVSFTLHAGEILGLTGPMSSGRMALAHALFGIQPVTGGEIFVGGQGMSRMQPRKAMRSGMGLIPRHRHKEGLVVDASITRNISLPSLDRLSRAGVVQRKQELTLAQTFIERLGIKAKSAGQPVRELSGGNQQKVVLSKWMAISPQVLILDEPTQGVDVASKEEIYQLMVELAGQGVGILFISSEPGELARFCHRVMIMRRGRIVKTLEQDELNPARIVEQVTGAEKA